MVSPFLTPTKQQTESVMYFFYHTPVRLAFGALLLMFFTGLTTVSGAEDPLMTKDNYTLTEANVKVYQQYLSFLIEGKLTAEEEKLIRDEVINLFDQSPSQVSFEIRSLEHVLDYVNHISSEEQKNIRAGAIQTALEYQDNGELNAFVRIISSHKMNPPD